MPFWTRRKTAKERTPAADTVMKGPRAGGGKADGLKKKLVLGLVFPAS